jgi:hypothetical protein
MAGGVIIPPELPPKPPKKVIQPIQQSNHPHTGLRDQLRICNEGLAQVEEQLALKGDKEQDLAV